MNKLVGVVAAVALGGLLAACGNNTAEIAKMGVKGGAYEKGLHKGYLKLARDEHKEYDYGDAVTFEERAVMAAKGKPTAPEMVSARSIPKKHQKGLAAGYKRLTAAMSKGGAKKAGKHAAAAQTSFECWMQEAEENLQKKHIAACRNKFYGDMAQLENAVYASPVKVAKKKKKKARKPQTIQYVVYFDFNSAKLSKSGMNAVDFIKGNTKKGAKISLAAFADRAGSPEYNNILATKRAKAVFGALQKAGIKDDIGISVFGEEKNSVKTKDGVKQKLNRRVEVLVTQ
ncbi:MAG: OmpA family protein [Rhodospirillaceae bacterium]|jgi:OmpA-OmpF porin, OOP family|nr:OmpA family protein [Rhodospirillaceae bacterium]MBT5455402.1 OmpA family protein [Rhodospirillaceae bacterium]